MVTQIHMALTQEWVVVEDILRISDKFGTVYEAIASEKGLKFLNACEWDLPLCYDGVHLTEEAHLHFAEKIIFSLEELYG